MRATTWILALAVCCASAAAGERIVESRKLNETVALDGAGVVTVEVNNVYGSIRVEGHDLPSVELVAEETVRARSNEARDRARKDVWLDVRREGDRVIVRVDGEFRRCEGRGNWSRDCRGWDGYTVTYDIVLRVPRRSDLELKTVNEGEVVVRDVRGRFEARNVNGKVTLEGVTGPGAATTVNGTVRVVFVENPDGDCEFTTVNGKIDLGFRRGLDADLRFKTFNGDAMTDFEVAPLPGTSASERLEDGRRVIEMNNWTAVRAGRGGPQLSCETLNGDILIREVTR